MRNILVIEDSPLVLKILEHLFRKESGFQPIFCASFGEAQVMLETSVPLCSLPPLSTSICPMRPTVKSSIW